MDLIKAANIYLKASSFDDEMSEGVQYYIMHGMPTGQSVADIFRPGSSSFCKLFKELRRLVSEGKLEPNEELADYLETDVGETGEFEGAIVPLDIPFVDEKPKDMNDAKYQGKDVELNKPKRGGSKKFYVYVKDGDKVKKVSFGSPDMSLRVSDPEARKSFKARHKCETRNDKTKASYWSCRIGRYPNLTGAKQKYTWW